MFIKKKKNHFMIVRSLKRLRLKHRNDSTLQHNSIKVTSSIEAEMQKVNHLELQQIYRQDELWIQTGAIFTSNDFTVRLDSSCDWSVCFLFLS